MTLISHSTGEYDIMRESELLISHDLKSTRKETEASPGCRKSVSHTLAKAEREAAPDRNYI